MVLCTLQERHSLVLWKGFLPNFYFVINFSLVFYFMHQNCQNFRKDVMLRCRRQTKVSCCSSFPILSRKAGRRGLPGLARAAHNARLLRQGSRQQAGDSHGQGGGQSLWRMMSCLLFSFTFLSHWVNNMSFVTPWCGISRSCIITCEIILIKH